MRPVDVVNCFRTGCLRDLSQRVCSICRIVGCCELLSYRMFKRFVTALTIQFADLPRCELLSYRMFKRFVTATAETQTTPGSCELLSYRMFKRFVTASPRSWPACGGCELLSYRMFKRFVTAVFRLKGCQPQL